MRKIAANYIMPVSSPPLRNGIVVLEDDGSILEVIDTGGKLRESSNLEFYNGIIIPGFVLPWYRPGGKENTFSGMADTLSGAEFKDLDNRLLQRGIKGIGIVERTVGHITGKKESAVFYHTILELCPGKNQDEFEVYQLGIEVISEAWNDYDQPCSVSCCTSSLMETGIMEYILEYAATHQLLIPLENTQQWALSDQLSRLKQHMGRVSEEPSSGIKLNARLLLVHDMEKQLPAEVQDLAETFATYHTLRPDKDFNMLKIMLALQGLSLVRSPESIPERTLQEVLQEYTLSAAEAIFEDDILGSIEPGKTPGLNLLSNTEPGTFRLKENSTLRVLV